MFLEQVKENQSDQRSSYQSAASVKDKQTFEGEIKTNEEPRPIQDWSETTIKANTIPGRREDPDERKAKTKAILERFLI